VKVKAEQAVRREVHSTDAGAAVRGRVMSDTPPVTPREPDDCQSMEDVRIGVDTVDMELVALLARRFDYMRAAARIKPERTQVRDEVRKATVIANARKQAETLGLPEEMIADLWDRLVEGSIAYELERWDALRSQG